MDTRPTENALTIHAPAAARSREKYQLDARLPPAMNHLRIRLVAISTGIMLLACTMICGSAGALVRGLALSRQETHATHLARLIARCVAPNLVPVDRVALRGMIGAWVSEECLRRIDVCGPSGHVLATARRARGVSGAPFERLPAADVRAYDEQARTRRTPFGDGSLLTLREPVYDTRAGRGGAPMSAAPLLGYVAVWYAPNDAVTAASQTASNIWWICAATGIGLMLIHFLAAQYLVGFLHRLGRTMTRLVEGARSARMAGSGREGLASVAAAFNTMAEAFDRQRYQLATVTNDLENRIRVRTKRLQELAVREPLTGLFNRRHFDDVLVRRFCEAERYGLALSCMMVDLDNFKRVNDRFGHPAGDEILVMVANTIVSELRAADLAARYGGDEFVALLPQTDIHQARTLGRRVNERFGARLAERFSHIDISISIGIAAMPHPAIDSADELVRVADRALYRAKACGKNRVMAAAGVA